MKCYTLRPDRCPHCGDGPTSIWLDTFTGEWACRMCGWRSGQRAAVPVVPDTSPGGPRLNYQGRVIW